LASEDETQQVFKNTFNEGLARQSIDEMLQGDTTPTYEPTLSMLDNNILNLIKVYAEAFMAPDLLNFIPILTHLNATSNLSKDEALVAYCDSEIAMLQSRIIHRNRSSVLHLLDTLSQRIYILLYGDAEDGKRQKYIATLAGAYKELKVGPGGQKENKPWWRR